MAIITQDAANVIQTVYNAAPKVRDAMGINLEKSLGEYADSETGITGGVLRFQANSNASLFDKTESDMESKPIEGIAMAIDRKIADISGQIYQEAIDNGVSDGNAKELVKRFAQEQFSKFNYNKDMDKKDKDSFLSTLAEYSIVDKEGKYKTRVSSSVTGYKEYVTTLDEVTEKITEGDLISESLLGNTLIGDIALDVISGTDKRDAYRDILMSDNKDSLQINDAWKWGGLALSVGEGMLAGVAASALTGGLGTAATVANAATKANRAYKFLNASSYVLYSVAKGAYQDAYRNDGLAKKYYGDHKYQKTYTGEFVNSRLFDLTTGIIGTAVSPIAEGAVTTGTVALAKKIGGNKALLQGLAISGLTGGAADIATDIAIDYSMHHGAMALYGAFGDNDMPIFTKSQRDMLNDVSADSLVSMAGTRLFARGFNSLLRNRYENIRHKKTGANDVSEFGSTAWIESSFGTNNKLSKISASAMFKFTNAFMGGNHWKGIHEDFRAKSLLGGKMEGLDDVLKKESTSMNTMLHYWYSKEMAKNYMFSSAVDLMGRFKPSFFAGSKLTNNQRLLQLIARSTINQKRRLSLKTDDDVEQFSTFLFSKLNEGISTDPTTGKKTSTLNTKDAKDALDSTLAYFTNKFSASEEDRLKLYRSFRNKLSEGFGTDDNVIKHFDELSSKTGDIKPDLGMLEDVSKTLNTELDKLPPSLIEGNRYGDEGYEAFARDFSDPKFTKEMIDADEALINKIIPDKNDSYAVIQSIGNILKSKGISRDSYEDINREIHTAGRELLDRYANAIVDMANGTKLYADDDPSKVPYDEAARRAIEIMQYMRSINSMHGSMITEDMLRVKSNIAENPRAKDFIQRVSRDASKYIKVDSSLKDMVKVENIIDAIAKEAVSNSNLALIGKSRVGIAFVDDSFNVNMNVMESLRLQGEANPEDLSTYASSRLQAFMPGITPLSDGEAFRLNGAELEISSSVEADSVLRRVSYDNSILNTEGIDRIDTDEVRKALGFGFRKMISRFAIDWQSDSNSDKTRQGLIDYISNKIRYASASFHSEDKVSKGIIDKLINSLDYKESKVLDHFLTRYSGSINKDKASWDIKFDITDHDILALRDELPMMTRYIIEYTNDLNTMDDYFRDTSYDGMVPNQSRTAWSYNGQDMDLQTILGKVKSSMPTSMNFDTDARIIVGSTDSYDAAVNGVKNYIKQQAPSVAYNMVRGELNSEDELTRLSKAVVGTVLSSSNIEYTYNLSKDYTDDKEVVSAFSSRPIVNAALDYSGTGLVDVSFPEGVNPREMSSEELFSKYGLVELYSGTVNMTGKYVRVPNFHDSKTKQINIALKSIVSRARQEDVSPEVIKKIEKMYGVYDDESKATVAALKLIVSDKIKYYTSAKEIMDKVDIKSTEDRVLQSLNNLDSLKQTKFDAIDNAIKLMNQGQLDQTMIDSINNSFGVKGTNMADAINLAIEKFLPTSNKVNNATSLGDMAKTLESIKDSFIIGVNNTQNTLNRMKQALDSDSTDVYNKLISEVASEFDQRYIDAFGGLEFDLALMDDSKGIIAGVPEKFKKGMANELEVLERWERVHLPKIKTDSDAKKLAYNYMIYGNQLLAGRDPEKGQFEKRTSAATNLTSKESVAVNKAIDSMVNSANKPRIIIAQTSTVQGKSPWDGTFEVPRILFNLYNSLGLNEFGLKVTMNFKGFLAKLNGMSNSMSTGKRLVNSMPKGDNDRDIIVRENDIIIYTDDIKALGYETLSKLGLLEAFKNKTITSGNAIVKEWDDIPDTQQFMRQFIQSINRHADLGTGGREVNYSGAFQQAAFDPVFNQLSKTLYNSTREDWVADLKKIAKDLDKDPVKFASQFQSYLRRTGKVSGGLATAMGMRDLEEADTTIFTNMKIKPFSSKTPTEITNYHIPSHENIISKAQSFIDKNRKSMSKETLDAYNLLVRVHNDMITNLTDIGTATASNISDNIAKDREVVRAMSVEDQVKVMNGTAILELLSGTDMRLSNGSLKINYNKNIGVAQIAKVNYQGQDMYVENVTRFPADGLGSSQFMFVKGIRRAGSHFGVEMPPMYYTWVQNGDYDGDVAVHIGITTDQLLDAYKANYEGYNVTKDNLAEVIQDRAYEALRDVTVRDSKSWSLKVDDTIYKESYYNGKDNDIAVGSIGKAKRVFGFWNMLKDSFKPSTSIFNSISNIIATRKGMTISDSSTDLSFVRMTNNSINTNNDLACLVEDMRVDKNSDNGVTFNALGSIAYMSYSKPISAKGSPLDGTRLAYAVTGSDRSTNVSILVLDSKNKNFGSGVKYIINTLESGVPLRQSLDMLKESNIDAYLSDLGNSLIRNNASNERDIESIMGSFISTSQTSIARELGMTAINKVSKPIKPITLLSSQIVMQQADNAAVNSAKTKVAQYLQYMYGNKLANSIEYLIKTTYASRPFNIDKLGTNITQGYIEPTVKMSDFNDIVGGRTDSFIKDTISRADNGSNGIPGYRDYLTLLKGVSGSPLDAKTLADFSRVSNRFLSIRNSLADKLSAEMYIALDKAGVLSSNISYGNKDYLSNMIKLDEEIDIEGIKYKVEDLMVTATNPMELEANKIQLPEKWDVYKMHDILKRAAIYTKQLGNSISQSTYDMGFGLTTYGTLLNTSKISFNPSTRDEVLVNVLNNTRRSGVSTSKEEITRILHNLGYDIQSKMVPDEVSNTTLIMSGAAKGMGLDALQSSIAKRRADDIEQLVLTKEGNQVSIDTFVRDMDAYLRKSSDDRRKNRVFRVKSILSNLVTEFDQVSQNLGYFRTKGMTSDVVRLLLNSNRNSTNIFKLSMEDLLNLKDTELGKGRKFNITTDKLNADISDNIRQTLGFCEGV